MRKKKRRKGNDGCVEIVKLLTAIINLLIAIIKLTGKE